MALARGVSEGAAGATGGEKHAGHVTRTLSTFESYRNTIRKLVAHLGHDDATRVKTADILAFKDARVAAGISLTTIKNNDLTGLKALFRRAMDNGRLEANPASGVTVLRGRSAQRRNKSFTNAEALSILRDAQSYQPSSREDSKLSAAKRWAPWLCAYTGARLGEIAQLRGPRHEAGG